jgi:hypothetical protein
MNKPNNMFTGVFGDGDDIEDIKVDEKQLDIVEENPTLTPVKKPVGRPKAKKSDPKYRPAAAYIKVETDKAVRKQLIDLELEYSELVEYLLEFWLDMQNGGDLENQWTRFLDRQNTNISKI